MKICPLAERPDLVPTVAEWLYLQFGHLNPGASLERSITRVKERLQTEGCPLTFISLDDGIPTGTASLIVSDFDSCPEITPWLASVYVQPMLRRSGIGSQLSKTVAAHAKSCGYEKLFLFTPNMQSFFGTLGWRESNLHQYHGVDVSIMELAL
jgi:N-acetylglutamate synthase-like GNAT family acetyltransferase